MFVCLNISFIASVRNQPLTGKDPNMSFTTPYFDKTKTNNSIIKEKHINENPGTKNVKDSPSNCDNLQTDETSHSEYEVVAVVKEMLSPSQDTCTQSEISSFCTKPPIVELEAFKQRTWRDAVTVVCAVPYCRKICKSKTALAHHMWAWHRLEKTIPCPDPGCEKMFHNANNIREHLRVHHDYKKLKCDVHNCEFSSLHYFQMNTHKKRVHLKQKAKKCEEQGCEKSFNDMTGVEDHLRKAHGYQELECGLTGCGATFKKMREFRKHRHDVHGLVQ